MILVLEFIKDLEAVIVVEEVDPVMERDSSFNNW